MEVVDRSPGESKDDNIEFSDKEEDEFITDINPNAKFLSATVDELVKRFNHLFTEFIQQGKHGHRNKLVFLLDKFSRQESINRDEYKQLNTMLTETLEEEMDFNTDDEVYYIIRKN